MGESSLQVTALLRAWNDGDLDARDGAMALVPPHRSSRVPSPRSGKTGIRARATSKGRICPKTRGRLRPFEQIGPNRSGRPGDVLVYPAQSPAQVEPHTQHHATRIDKCAGLTERRAEVIVGGEAFFSRVIERVQHIHE
jgi:hypothetical protein